jgi:PAS domain S-box-containing protein
VFELNLADGQLVWSPEVYALFGVTPEVFKPTRASFRMLVHPEDRAIPWQMLLAPESPRPAVAPDLVDTAANAAPAADVSAEAPPPHTLEFRVQRPDGQWRWIGQRGQTEPEVNAGHRRYFGVVFDISERKAAEAEKARSSQRLREQQFYTRSLIDCSIDALVVTDASGTVTDANRQMEKLTGCTHAELVGSAFTALFSDPQRAQGSLDLTLERLSLLDHELHLLSRDGSPTLVSLNGSTFYDRQRKLQGVIFSTRDVTQRHFLDQALQETNQFLESARFVAVKDRQATTDLLLQSSQELLPQLRSILGCAERLHTGPPTPAPAQSATIAQMLQDSRLLLARVQAAMGQLAQDPALAMRTPLQENPEP